MLSLMDLGVLDVAALGHTVDTLAAGIRNGEGIVREIKEFILPILFLIVGFVAVTFLFKREMTKFFQFAIITMLVGLFLFAGEDIIRGGAELLKGIFVSGGGGG